MQSIFHNHFGGEIEAEALKKSVLQKAITLHPIKRPRQMYLMHRIFLEMKSAELRHQLIELDRDSKQMLNYQVVVEKGSSMSPINAVLRFGEIMT